MQAAREPVCQSTESVPFRPIGCPQKWTLFQSGAAAAAHCRSRPPGPLEPGQPTPGTPRRGAAISPPAELRPGPDRIAPNASANGRPDRRRPRRNRHRPTEMPNDTLPTPPAGRATSARGLGADPKTRPSWDRRGAAGRRDSPEDRNCGTKNPLARRAAGRRHRHAGAGPHSGEGRVGP